MIKRKAWTESKDRIKALLINADDSAIVLIERTDIDGSKYLIKRRITK
jgi:hypothetical protein